MNRELCMILEVLRAMRDCLQRMEQRQIENTDDITKQFKRILEEIDEDG